MPKGTRTTFTITVKGRNALIKELANPMKNDVDLEPWEFVTLGALSRVIKRKANRRATAREVLREMSPANRNEMFANLGDLLEGLRLLKERKLVR